MNPAAQFPLKDLTTKAVWDRLDAQVFQVAEGVQQFETFVIRDKKVQRIGQRFGGQGVTSLAVADPNGDGRDKLIFAYSWGSGEHRSQIALLDCLAKESVQIAAPQTYFGKDDLVLKNSEGNKVEIYLGKQKAGRLIVEAKEGRLTADVQVNDDVDLEVRKKFH
jgi:hypothetical protein